MMLFGRGGFIWEMRTLVDDDVVVVLGFRKVMHRKELIMVAVHRLMIALARKSLAGGPFFWLRTLAWAAEKLGGACGAIR